MRKVTRLMGCAVAATAIVMGLPATAAAEQADNGVRLDLRSARAAFAVGDRVELTAAVTNTGTVACGLSRNPTGTVQVISVRRDGQELTPTLTYSMHEDGIDNAIGRAIVPAEPGSTVDVSVVSSGGFLRSVTPAPGGVGLDALWPVGEPGRYEVTASYAVPPLTNPATACPGATAAQTVTLTVGQIKEQFPLLWVLAAATALLLIALAVAFALRRRRRQTATAAMVVIGLLLGGVALARPARADWDVTDQYGIPIDGFSSADLRSNVEACLTRFAQPGSDPIGLLPRLKDKNSAKVLIGPTTQGSDTYPTGDSPNGKGSSVIVWNPFSTDPYEGDVARDPCAALYHELSHSHDIARNEVPQGMCGDTGIPTAEVKATFAENRYRVAKGLPPRKKYKGKDLPKSMEDCKKPTKKTPPPKGPVPLCEGTANQCGGSNGDPHMVTFDRTYYDFQAVGEFILVQSTGGDPLEIQTRQAPMGDSRTVSINSAVGFRVGTQKIELKLVDGVTELRVDGQPGNPNGSSLVRRESDISPVGGYDIVWPDGSAAAVDQIGRYGYRILVRLAPARAGKVRGLLGDFDGDPANDIPQPATFEALYPSYADSWRIRPADSLFSYANGESTETFTDRAYPAKPMTINDLDPARRAMAEQICRRAGVIDPWQFNECVLDVGVTGRPDFAIGSTFTEVIAPPSDAPIAVAPLASGTLIAGSTDRLTFAGRAGQAIFAHAVGPSMPDRCSPYRLLDPAGREINSGCNISGVGHIERTELAIDGQYTILIDPLIAATGKATIRVYLARDVEGTLQPNGAPVSAALEAPGSLGRYRFPGQAGQRIFVEAPASTLPDQCSPLELRDPGNGLLTTGCVINGYGAIEGTILPVDGTYTVVVDPRDRTIGTVQMSLFVSADQTGPIASGAAAVTATIGTPGAVVRYQFSAAAGARVRLDATESTLPDQCSPLELRGPAGDLVSTGCLINGVGGISDTVLAGAGLYTIVIDPRGAATGTVKLALQQTG